MNRRVDEPNPENLENELDKALTRLASSEVKKELNELVQGFSGKLSLCRTRVGDESSKINFLLTSDKALGLFILGRLNTSIRKVLGDYGEVALHHANLFDEKALAYGFIDITDLSSSELPAFLLKHYQFTASSGCSKSGITYPTGP